MEGWWRKNPYFIEYMVHEGTALFVAAYALILLVSITCLARGEAAWNQWLAILTNPLCIFVHVLLLVGFLYHTWTWFNIMPRTLPPIIMNGARVTAATITRTGLAAALIASLIIFIIAASLAS